MGDYFIGISIGKVFYNFVIVCILVKNTYSNVFVGGQDYDFVVILKRSFRFVISGVET